MADLSLRERCVRLVGELNKAYDDRRPVWEDLAHWIAPRRGRFTTDSRELSGNITSGHIIDNTAGLALRTLSSGMMGGITSPARPWFQLGTPDDDLNDWGPVREWLHQTTESMRTVFLRSNLYNALPELYGDLGMAATAPMTVLEDERETIRCYTMPVGSYRLGIDSRRKVDSCARVAMLTCRQIMQRWGDKASAAVRHAVERGATEQRVPVWHVIFPNESRDPKALDIGASGKWTSVYYEEGGDGNAVLGVSGFNEFPLMAPRWDTAGEDVYGYGPGDECLSDVKALQMYHKRKAQAVELGINPPLQGPSSLRTARVSLLPGAITYIEGRDAGDGLRPVHQTDLNIRDVQESILEHQERIRRALYEDMFLMLSMSDRRQITAREVEERHGEKLLMLGPVLERLNDELLDPLIDRTFSIMLRRGEIPPPPQELQGQQLRVEYVSIMAQAQKLVGLAGSERFLGFVGQVAQFQPQALDKVDFDAAIDEHAAMLGVAPTLIRSQEAVDQIRQQRVAQQQQEAQMAQMQAEASAAKDLGNTPIDPQHALGAMLGAGA